MIFSLLRNNDIPRQLLATRNLWRVGEILYGAFSVWGFCFCLNCLEKGEGKVVTHVAIFQRAVRPC